jgi:dTDP-4-amino-4,6-dideoxygalactose transaminase
VLRTLPAAGHKIGFGAIFRALLLRAGSGSEFELCASFPRFVVTPSGTAALTLALQALREGSSRKEVVLPAYTCPSVAAAVIKAGLQPVLCDLSPGGLGVDRDQLASRLGSNTLAVIVVHLFGIPDNAVRLRDLTKSIGAVLIEDATQAYGNTTDHGERRSLGTLGDIGVFSFGRGKPLSLLSGGAIVVNAEELDGPIRRVCSALPVRRRNLFAIRYGLMLTAYSFLFHPRLYWIPASLPWLHLGETVFSLEIDLSKEHPAVTRLGNVMREYFDRVRALRVNLTRLYLERLSSGPGCDLPSGVTGDESIALLRFPILMRDGEMRNAVLDASRRGGLGLSGMYPEPLDTLKGLEGVFPEDRSFPHASDVSRRLLTLPLHEYVTGEDVRRICAAVTGGPPRASR